MVRFVYIRSDLVCILLCNLCFMIASFDGCRRGGLSQLRVFCLNIVDLCIDLELKVLHKA